VLIPVPETVVWVSEVTNEGGSRTSNELVSTVSGEPPVSIVAWIVCPVSFWSAMTVVHETELVPSENDFDEDSLVENPDGRVREIEPEELNPETVTVNAFPFMTVPASAPAWLMPIEEHNPSEGISKIASAKTIIFSNLIF
jgi:hypothetical protein